MMLRETKLGGVVTLQRGHDLPEVSRKEGPVPVVSSSGITGYHNVAKAQPPGVVTGRYGTLGEVFYIEEPYWPLNTALYAIDFHGNNPRFVAYFLKQVLRSTRSDKAAVPGVNRNDLHEIQVRIPDTETQERIVKIASAYDDLIENNRRRIKLIEDATRLLYREWFVHFRFPGQEHVNVKIVDGLPEGWERPAVDDICTVARGASPRPIGSFVGGDVPWLKIGDATASGSPFIFYTQEQLTEDGAKHSVRVHPGDLILSNSATKLTGRFGLLRQNVVKRGSFEWGRHETIVLP